MSIRGVSRHLGAAILALAVSMLAWLAWLGWDQRYDEHPDGRVTGPYQAWQVVGLVVTLLVLGGLAVWQRRAVAVWLGASLGTPLAAALDWAEDGFWVIGVGLVGIGVLTVGGCAIGMASVLVSDRARTSAG
ncbi:hypothetical protein GCM10010191_48500 [Actinomadura vinacea]|uniref:Transporter n=1 Tax=Actinomadura vinacea TaxID=115336 RepID=A0ABN3JG59_9ACTN